MDRALKPSPTTAHAGMLYSPSGRPHTSFVLVMLAGSMKDRFVESFTRFPDGLAFAEPRPVRVPVCTTFGIVSRSRPCFDGIAPGKMSSVVYPSYRRISVTDTSPTPTG